jgi:protein-S-isoprenylcysteine O-methyltransferase Ste14
MNAKAVSILAVLALIAAVGYLAYTGDIFAREPVGLAVQVLAFVFMIWARITFGMRSFHASANPTQGGLVTTGPYRFVRHPIYAAAWLFSWIGIAEHPSWTNIALGLVIAVTLVIRMLAEEQLVIERYPEYSDYARRTKRVLPGVF